jgi:hypothetical protein
MARRALDISRSERVAPTFPLSDEQKRRALCALDRLAALRKGLPPVDAVEVIRSVRDDPADRGTD